MEYPSRFGSFRGPSVSLDRPFDSSSHDTLDSMISKLTINSLEQIVESAYVEPNLSLVLDVCEKINKTGKSAPRQAAFIILRHVNRGSNSVANLALTVIENS
jgi:hypothetical protein